MDFVVSKEEGEASASRMKDDKDDTELPERTTNFTAKEWQGISSDDDKPMLIALHGLTGGSHEVYLR